MGRDLQGYIEMQPHNRRRARSPRPPGDPSRGTAKVAPLTLVDLAIHVFLDRPFAKSRSDHAGVGRDLAGKDPRVDVGTALAQPPESRLYGVA
jgi:hypothetical protein